MKTKEQTIELLETIARLLELKGENPFKIRAYTNAARALETFSGNFQATVTEEKLGELDGIGDAITKKISEYVGTGRLEYFEKLQADFPETIFELFEITRLAGKKVKALYEKLDIKTIAELEAGAKDGRVAALPGFGAKTAANLLQSIEQRRKRSGRILLSDAKIWSDELLGHLQGHPDVSQISTGGSFRRGRETIGDLDFLVATKHPQEVIEYFLTHDAIDRVLARGETKASVLVNYGIQADLRVVTKRAPTDEELTDLLFAFRVCKHVKSNAIVYAKNGATVGVGAGQMSRVDSVKIAVMKAQSPLTGSVVASDAFFPFPDGVEEAAKAGATAVIQPGGSVKDSEVIATADRLGLAMVFTNMRHFLH